MPVVAWPAICPPRINCRRPRSCDSPSSLTCSVDPVALPLWLRVAPTRAISGNSHDRTPGRDPGPFPGTSCAPAFPRYQYHPGLRWVDSRRSPSGRRSCAMLGVPAPSRHRGVQPFPHVVWVKKWSVGNRLLNIDCLVVTLYPPASRRSSTILCKDGPVSWGTRPILSSSRLPGLI